MCVEWVALDEIELELTERSLSIPLALDNPWNDQLNWWLSYSNHFTMDHIRRRTENVNFVEPNGIDFYSKNMFTKFRETVIVCSFHSNDLTWSLLVLLSLISSRNLLFTGRIGRPGFGCAAQVARSSALHWREAMSNNSPGAQALSTGVSPSQ